MKSKIEKLETRTSQRKISGTSICFAVCKIGLKKQRILASAMKNILWKNHHGIQKLSGTNVGRVSACCDFWAKKLLLEKIKMLHGAPGIEPGSPNCFISPGVTPSAIMSHRTLMGSSSRSFAVLMMGIINATLFCPFGGDILPKEIFLDRTL